jgi:hypothetical protein
MPVAALIVVGPGIEVKAVERNPLRADWDHEEERPNLAIEAILVHSEVRRGVAQADKARQERRYAGGRARALGALRREGMYDHQRPC